ncbi:acyltransferase family protein [Gordonia phosphorivorans]|uniref:Acyltransferase family protein n=1 Tax=Gordonia phosphorivorans TaxID=1056982 RepID=A0ABV6H3L0_9ACTN
MTSSRSAPLTGIRALAALAVCLTHAAFWTGRYTDDLEGRFFARFEIGVAIFFVLSGFLLFQPWVRALRQAQLTGGRRQASGAQPAAELPSVGRYAWHRFRRVVPAYWITVIAVYLIFLVRSDPGQTGQGWGSFLRNMTFTQVYGFGHLRTGLSQMWSMAAEMAFYVVLPLLAWPIAVLVCKRRWRPDLLLLSLGVLALVSPVWTVVVHGMPTADPTARLWPPAFASWFVGGMVLAVLVEVLRRWNWQVSVPVAVAAFLVSAGSFAGGPTIIPDDAGQTIIKHLLYLVVALGLIGPLAVGMRSGAAPDPWQRFLGARPVVWFGEISYEFFLVHVIVLEFAMGWLGYPIFTGSTALAFLTTVAVATPIAWLLHLLVATPEARERARFWRAATGKLATDGGFVVPVPRRTRR